MATIKTQAQSAWSPDTYVFDAQEVLPEALILQTSSVMAEIEGDAPSLRIGYVSDASAMFVAEAGVISPTEPTLSEAEVFTGKISILSRISREQWEKPATAGALAASVSRSILRKADQAYIAQAVPTPPATAPSAGLLNVAGSRMVARLLATWTALLIWSRTSKRPVRNRPTGS